MRNKLFKKIALAMSFISMLGTLPVNAYELDSQGMSIENVKYQTSTDEDFTNETSVFAEIGSTYQVTIPKVIVLSGESKLARYQVSVDGDIAGYETVCVIPDETVNLYSVNKESQVGVITQDRINWTYSTLSEVADGLIVANNITAGKWTGTFNFNINFNKIFGDVIDPDHVHNPSNVKVENLVEPDCITPGSYENVVYCSVCNEELSRELITAPAKGHSYELVEKISANCDTSSTEKYKCSVCSDIMYTHDNAKLGHTPDEVQIENLAQPDCVNTGSYDEVTYCAVCGEELSRSTKIIDALGHTPFESVKENVIEADCLNPGSYENVVYCAICDEELSRENIITPLLGHTYENGFCIRCNVRDHSHTCSKVKIENQVLPTANEDGHHEEVYVCDICGLEYNRVYVVDSRTVFCVRIRTIDTSGNGASMAIDYGKVDYKGNFTVESTRSQHYGPYSSGNYSLVNISYPVNGGGWYARALTNIYYGTSPSNIKTSANSGSTFLHWDWSQRVTYYIIQR